MNAQSVIERSFKREESMSTEKGSTDQNRAGRKEVYAVHTRDVILLRAMELFGEKGYNGATIRQIAQKAMVSDGLIHHHFKNKSQLLLEVFRRYFKLRPDDIVSIMEKEEKPANRSELEHLLTSLFDIIHYQMNTEPHRSFFKMILNSMGQMGAKEKKEIVEEIHKEMWIPMSEIIYRSLPSQERKRIDPYYFFRMLQGAFMGYVLFQDLFEWKEIVPMDKEVYRDMVVETVLKGVGIRSKKV